MIIIASLINLGVDAISRGFNIIAKGSSNVDSVGFDRIYFTFSVCGRFFGPSGGFCSLLIQTQ